APTSSNFSLDIGNALQCILDILGGQNLLHSALDIQTGSVVAGVRFISHSMYLALNHKLVIVQVTGIGGYAEVVTHILTAQTLFAGHQSLEQLLAVTSADDVRASIAKQLLDGLGQIADGRGISLLDEQVAG